MKIMGGLRYLCLIFLLFGPGESFATLSEQVWFKTMNYLYHNGTQLVFVTITNNLPKPILLHSESSVKGSVFSKDFLEQNQVPIASKHIAKQKYIIHNDPFISVFIMLMAGGIAFTAAMLMGDLLKGADLISQNRNLKKGALATSGIAVLSCGLLLHGGLTNAAKQDQELRQLFDGCQFWLEAPSGVIDSGQSVTFSLLISGKYEIIGFDANSKQAVVSFIGGLA